MFLLLGSLTMPSAENTEEYGIKAAFIYRFTNYIEWDTPLSGNEFVIGVFGPSPIREALVEIAKTKTIKGKKIIIRQFNNPDDIRPCHILFISQKATQSLQEILLRVPDKGTLTISERTGYAAMGTQINLIQVDNSLKFEVNPRALYAEGLTAGSQLLKLAIIIN